VWLNFSFLIFIWTGKSANYCGSFLKLWNVVKRMSSTHYTWREYAYMNSRYMYWRSINSGTRFQACNCMVQLHFNVGSLWHVIFKFFLLSTFGKLVCNPQEGSWLAGCQSPDPITETNIVWQTYWEPQPSEIPVLVHYLLATKQKCKSGR
jgi:hypothetical protein